MAEVDLKGRIERKGRKERKHCWFRDGRDARCTVKECGWPLEAGKKARTRIVP